MAAEEVMGIIKDAHYGLRDTNQPVLWFTVYTSENSASLQVFGQPEADAIIARAQAHDVRDLNGKPCWVRKNGGLVEFLRVWAP